MKSTFLLLGFLLLSFSGQAQSMQDLLTQKQKYKTCVDQGRHMLGCTQRYYQQMDSLLNVVYSQLRAPMNASQKAALKQEQLKWLKERDRYFKQTDQEMAQDPALGGKDRQMVVLDQKATFVEQRVKALLKRQTP